MTRDRFKFLALLLALALVPVAGFAFILWSLTR